MVLDLRPDAGLARHRIDGEIDERHVALKFPGLFRQIEVGVVELHAHLVLQLDGANVRQSDPSFDPHAIDVDQFHDWVTLTNRLTGMLEDARHDSIERGHHRIRRQLRPCLSRRQRVQLAFVLGLLDSKSRLVGGELQLQDLQRRHRHHDGLSLRLRFRLRLFIRLDVLLMLDLGHLAGHLVEPYIDVVVRLRLGDVQVRPSHLVRDQHHLLFGLDRIPLMKLDRLHHSRPIARQRHLPNQHDPALGQPNLF